MMATAFPKKTQYLSPAIITRTLTMMDEWSAPSEVRSIYRRWYKKTGVDNHLCDLVVKQPLPSPPRSLPRHACHYYRRSNSRCQRAPCSPSIRNCRPRPRVCRLNRTYATCHNLRWLPLHHPCSLPRSLDLLLDCTRFLDRCRIRTSAPEAPVPHAREVSRRQGTASCHWCWKAMVEAKMGYHCWRGNSRRRITGCSAAEGKEVAKESEGNGVALVRCLFLEVPFTHNNLSVRPGLKYSPLVTGTQRRTMLVLHWTLLYSIGVLLLLQRPT